MDKSEIKKAIMIALGEASMCWNPIPTGEFLSEKAAEIGEKLWDEITAD